MNFCRKYRGPRWRSRGVHAPSRRTLGDVSRHPHIMRASNMDKIAMILGETNDVFADLPCPIDIKGEWVTATISG